MKQEIEQLIDRLASKELTFQPYDRVKLDPAAVTELDGKPIEGVFRLLKQAGSPYHGCWKILKEGSARMFPDWLPEDHFINLGHNILIGDVLEKAWQNEGFGCLEMARLAELWGPIGFTKSLQEIYAEAEWEKVECSKCNSDGFTAEHDLPERHGEDGECISCPVQVQCESCRAEGTVEIPKQSHIRELLQFLLQLGL